MEENNKYSRREFSKKLFAGTFVVGGALTFGLGSLKALAQTKPKPKAKTAAKPVAKAPAAKAPADSAKKAAPANTNAMYDPNNPCDDLTGVPPAELEKRKKMAYVTKAPVPDKHCGNCALYLKPGPGKTCGKCLLFKGPVRAEAACAYWSPIVNTDQ